jgi:hypothetical protein
MSITQTTNMPPRGGARQAIKIIAVSESNPDEVLSFDSMTAAAKGLNIAHHSTISRALMRNGTVNGYKLTQMQDNTQDTDTQASTSETDTATAHQGVLTLWEEVDELFKGCKIRYTTEDPKRVSVYDIIKAITGVVNPRDAFAKLQQEKKELVGEFYKLQFNGAGERPTPVCTVPQMIELINVLPGTRATRFRSAGAKVLVRFLGGDDSLVEELRENAERMEAIAHEGQSNPMNAFELPKGMTGANAVCSLMLSPIMQGKTVADMRGACTYLLLFKHQGELAIKFGWTKDLQKRVRDHYRMYPDMKVWAAWMCQFQEVAVETEKLFKGKMTAYLQQIQLGSKVSTEVLVGVDPKDAEAQMQDAIDTVTSEMSMHNPIVLKELEIERLRLQVELAKQETERLRLMLQLQSREPVANQFTTDYTV